jgi:diadenylate cyclase
MLDWVPIPNLLDVVDIALVASFGWLAIRYFRRTRARAAAIGLALLGGVYSIALALGLRLSASILQGFFAAVVIVLIVVFQQELRRLFERLGSWRGLTSRKPEGADAVDLLVRSIARLAQDRIGALFVLPRLEPIDRHVEGGVLLNGQLSEPLLLSIFDSSSAGHDGAVIVRGDQVERFASHLPLSSNHEALGPGGTRHAAALGLSERCDAICVAVSEERGTISVAQDGELRVLAGPEECVRVLRAALEFETTPEAGAARRVWTDALIAAVGALLLWMVVVPGADMSELSVTAEVRVANLPRDLELESVDPAEVEVKLRGLRRDMLLIERNPVTVEIDGYLARFGRRTFMIGAQDVQAPRALDVIEVGPEKIKISAIPRAAAD